MSIDSIFSTSDLDQEFQVASHAGAEFFCENLRRLDSNFNQSGCRVLVAGCGAGHEAALIQRLLSARVDAIDVEDELQDPFRNWSGSDYQTASVCDLPFAAGCFDAIFYHHVIEHVDDPVQSLVELSRVLKPGGWIFIGTPNRHRLVSSVGAHQQTQWDPTWRNKLNDNLNDWSDRLRGRFRNEYGAHAGFSRKELAGMLSADFDQQHWVTRQYLERKYLGHRFRRAISFFAARPLSEISAPSIYVFSQKARR